MSAANDRFANLGPATEAILSRAFSDAVMITAQAAARIIGVDDKTFHALVEGRAIRYVLIGRSTKRYTEADIRAYLMRDTELPCRSTNPPRAVSGSMTSNTKVVGFMARRALKASATQRR
ncbi:helix-turn-helix domain-containing protein [Brevundimonas pondensis]|uniref:Helix-turn-helix domain-containing protein n=1 Tax=Brevundimonas pondensis TaxID=2774189 RepID=A0ABX7SJP9_9CAUL|nr:helix-turn-helix domain-containing protein [Brevundimonas pondensis]QTC87922.1 helix-turn-helix domain-containing protein [Brevundimonas pondensis]